MRRESGLVGAPIAEVLIELMPDAAELVGVEAPGGDVLTVGTHGLAGKRCAHADGNHECDDGCSEQNPTAGEACEYPDADDGEEAEVERQLVDERQQPMSEAACEVLARVHIIDEIGRAHV